MFETEDLRDPDFLLWLQQFVGYWRLAEEGFEVRRRGDGWLEARRLPGFKLVPLASALDRAEQFRQFDLRNGGTAAHQIHCWLTPEQYRRLRGGWHVGRGRQLISETLLKNRQEMPIEEIRARWLLQWEFLLGTEAPLSPEDYQTHETLLEQFLQAQEA